MQQGCYYCALKAGASIASLNLAVGACRGPAARTFIMTKKTWKITRIILQRLSAKFLSGVGGETPDGRKEQVAEEDM